MGYSHEAVKIIVVAGEVRHEQYIEHYPPDTTAAIFWLKNRKKREWRDKVEQELTGPDGGPIGLNLQVSFVKPDAGPVPE